MFSKHLHDHGPVVQSNNTKSVQAELYLLYVSILHHTSQASPPLALYELLSLLRAACAVFLVSPSDCCFACSATADRYPALCVWWARRHCWNNNRSACLYRAVPQLVQSTQESKCKTIIYNNTACGAHQSGGAHSWKRIDVWLMSGWPLKNKGCMLKDLDWQVWHHILYDEENTAYYCQDRDTLRPSWGRWEPAGMLQCSSTYSDNTTTYFW